MTTFTLCNVKETNQRASRKLLKNSKNSGIKGSDFLRSSLARKKILGK